jgi:hypothetical protein
VKQVERDDGILRGALDGDEGAEENQGGASRTDGDRRQISSMATASASC